MELRIVCGATGCPNNKSRRCALEEIEVSASGGCVEYGLYLAKVDASVASEARKRATQIKHSEFFSSRFLEQWEMGIIDTVCELKSKSPTPKQSKYVKIIFFKVEGLKDELGN